MTIRVTTSGDTTGVTHRWYPASEAHGAFGILAFGYNAGDAGADIHLHQPAEIDEVIAALTALRAKMTGEALDALAAAWPPVPAITITDDEHAPAVSE